MNTLKSRTNESNKFIYQFTDKLYLKNPNTNVALANLSIYYTWKNIKSGYNNNKIKIHDPTWNYEFDLPDRSYPVSCRSYPVYKIILNTSSKNLKLLQIILLYKFM